MEIRSVSEHEVAVYAAMRGRRGEWLTTADVYELAPDVGHRSVRAHLKKLANGGLLDEAQIFPGHRYRWSDLAEQRNEQYLHILEQAHQIVTSGMASNGA